MPQRRTVDVLFREQANHLLIEHVQRYNDVGLSKDKHFHEHLEIYYLVAGERNYYIRGRNFSVKPGDLVVVSGNVMHHAFPAEDPCHERILLEIYTPMLRTINAMFADTAPESMLTGVAGILHLTPGDRDRIQHLLHGLMLEMRSPRYGRETMIRCLLAQLLAYIVRNTVQEPSEHWESSEPKSAKILEISNYLAAHSAEKLSLDEISERFDISKYHLCRTFKDATGFTISEFINASRVMRARELLLTTDKSVAQIAKEVGFESSTHFGKVFKQQRGRSPMAYRKNDVNNV